MSQYFQGLIMQFLFHCCTCSRCLFSIMDICNDLIRFFYIPVLSSVKKNPKITVIPAITWLLEKHILTMFESGAVQQCQGWASWRGAPLTLALLHAVSLVANVVLSSVKLGQILLPCARIISFWKTIMVYGFWKKYFNE